MSRNTQGQERQHRCESIGQCHHFIGSARHPRRTDGVFGVQAPSSGGPLSGHRDTTGFFPGRAGARTDVTAPVATTTRRRKKPAKAEAENEILEKGRCSEVREQMDQLVTNIIRPSEKSFVMSDLADESPAVRVALYQIHRPSREIFWNPKMTKRRVANTAA